MKTFLHVGCGRNTKEHTTAEFADCSWKEIRVDIDEAMRPDIVATMTDMTPLADQSVDAIFSSHNIEHLYPHEVPVALNEFRRVLKIDGYLVVTCPDLQSVAELVVQDKLTEPAYVSQAGPVAAFDMLYGLRPALAAGNLFMAHRCGFTRTVLNDTLMSCGFALVASMRRPSAFDLWALAHKSAISEPSLKRLAEAHFPG